MPQPTTPYPRAIVSFEGQDVRADDIRSLEWETNVEWLADTLSVTLDNARDLSGFIRIEQPVDLYLGYVEHPYDFTKHDLTRVFSGAVDGVLPTWGADMTLAVKCRDHTRLLIDSRARNDSSWQNITDAQLVTYLAVQAGLRPLVSPGPIGVDAEREMASYLQMSGWEVVQTLAVLNGYIAYVTRDKELYWGPRSDTPPIGAWSYFDAPHDVLEASFDDSAAVVNKVTVVRWYAVGGATAELLQGSATDDALLRRMRGRVVEKVVVSTDADSIPRCEAEAARILRSLKGPALTGTVTLIGDRHLVGDARITLGGQLGRFRGDYYILAATHRYSTDGYTTTCQIQSERPEASDVYRVALNGDPLTQEEIAAIQRYITDHGPLPVGAVPTCGDAPVDWAAEWPEWDGPVAQLLIDNNLPATAEHATCGPIAAAGLLKAFKIRTDPGKLAKRGQQGDAQGAWWSGEGMAGPDNEVKLLASQLLPAKNLGRDIQAAIDRCSRCEPVIFDTAGGGTVGHYILASAYREADGRFFGGVTISNAMRASHGNPWASVAEIESYGLGAIRSVIVADVAVAPAVTASSGSTAATRGAMQRAPSDVQAVIRAGGWPEAQWDNAVAIVERETGGTWNPRAVSPTRDYGLFQINLATWKGETCDFLGLPRGTSDAVVIERLFDPLTNSQMAYRIWREVGHWGLPGGWATAAGLGLA